jgi:dTDP-4-amino-4,6-dideoxygalactose transaminase
VFSSQGNLTLEAALSEAYGLGYVVLFGNARSGIRALLEALGMAGKPVLIPSNMCSAPLAAVVAAEAEPVGVAVSVLNGHVTAERFNTAIRTAPAPGVVMPTHLYGHHQDYTELRADGWFVLENDTLCAAMAQGGTRRAIGDAVVVSFNDVKTIEAGGGGAILTDDAALAAELAAVAAKWAEVSATDHQVEEHLMLARRHLRALGRTPLSEALFDLDFPMTARAIAPAQRGVIEAAFARTPGIIEAKRRRQEDWLRALEPLATAFALPLEPPTVPWRLTLGVADTESRTKIVNALRSAGIDAGTNYPPLGREFPSYMPEQEDAEIWAGRVLNLWLTERYDQTEIRRAVDVMRAALNA